MDSDLGTWLRQQRENRGWPKAEMARRLIQAGRDNGDTTVPGTGSMLHNIHRWERAGGVSERHKLHYCRALGIHPGQFGPRHEEQPPGITPIEAPAPAGTPFPPYGPVGTPGPTSPYLPEPASVTYRGREEPDCGSFTVEREVLMAAHEGSGHAEQAEQRGIGDATLDQLRADVTRLSRELQRQDPLPVFLEMRRVRGRMHEALDRRMWPRDATALYFLLACLNDLMGVAADDMGYPTAAEELFRSAWAYAVAIDHRPLMARVRQDLAGLAYWGGRLREAADLAASGLEYLQHGPTGIQLHLYFGRAKAELGEAASARRAVAQAEEAGGQVYGGDDLTAIGSEFDLSRATERYLAGSVLIKIPEAAADAADALDRAAELYANGPGPGETYGFGSEALARVSLAEARLRTGGIEAAAQALGPVLALPPGKRITQITQSLGRVRAELHAPVFRGASEARDLDEQLETFTRESVTAGLHSPGWPG